MPQNIGFRQNTEITSNFLEIKAIFSDLYLATVSKNFKINLEGQNYLHFYVILSRNVKVLGIMASL